MAWVTGPNGQIQWQQEPGLSVQGGTPPGSSSGPLIPQPYGSGLTDANGNPYQTLGGAQQPAAGGMPSWVTPDQSQFYNTLNQGWMQGHSGQPIPQERFQYLQNAYNSEAAQGANGSHVGDMGWWQNRASIDRGPDPGEPGYTGQGQTLGQMGGGQFSPNAQNGVASFNAPGLLAPYTKEFQPTDINTILDAPAFKAAQANGIDQIQRSAAGHGTLLTGGTLKDLSSWNQGLALGELNNQFNRDATTFGTNRDTFYGNENNAYSKLSGFSGLGLNGANSLADQGTGYANRAQVGANNMGNLAVGQGDASAQAGLVNATNTNQTLGNLASNLGSLDWSQLFKGKKATIPQIPTNTGGSATGGAALPGSTR